MITFSLKSTRRNVWIPTVRCEEHDAGTAKTGSGMAATMAPIGITPDDHHEQPAVATAGGS